MPAITSFVVCDLGQWSQICERRDSRTALIVQLLGGLCVLGFNTAAPVEANDFGVMPAGVWHSNESGNGPGTFRLSKTIDGDIVTQSWWAFVVSAGSPTPAAPPLLASGDTGVWAAGPLSLVVAVPATALPVVVILFDALDANQPASLTSASAGLLAPIVQTQAVSVPGDLGDLQIFTYTPGGADTLTAASIANGAIRMLAFTTPAPGTNDQAGSATGTSTNPGTAAGGAVAQNAETVFFASWYYNEDATPSGALFVNPTGPILFSGGIIDNIAGWWWGAVAWYPGATGVPSALTQVAFVSGLPVSWCAALATFKYALPVVQTATVTVIESFDVVDVEAAEKYITANLPTVGPAAMEHLRLLQQKILAAQAPPQQEPDNGP